jgi:hypothetical protein
MRKSVEVIEESTPVRDRSARRHERTLVDFRVSLRWPRARDPECALNVSEGGVCVRTSDPLLARTLVSLGLEIPEHPLPLEVLGRVVWSTEQLMGIRFETTDARLGEVLARLRSARAA